MRFLTIWLLSAWLCAMAGATEPAGEDWLMPGLEPGPPPSAELVEAQAHDIGRKLRCPVCQGLSVADSASEAAVIMQRRIQDFVRAGYTEAEIRDYFSSKYGDWVLLDPPKEGLNWIIWAGPVIMLLGGLALVIVVASLGDEEDMASDSPQDTPENSPPASDSFEADLLAEVDDV
jgi:cytochrome c-type biogenesis protein CcmH